MAADPSKDPSRTDLTRRVDPTVVRRGQAVAAVRAAEAQSLDVVQRVVISVLLIVVMGSIAAVLALYLSFAPEQFSSGDRVALWSMTGVIGLLTAAGVLAVNRRKPYHPLVLLGLVPMLISGLLIF